MAEKQENLNENKMNEEEAKTPEEEKVKYQISIVDKWKEIMKAIKDKTGINGLYVIFFLLICVFLVYLGIFGTLIINIIGTIYPGFCTIKAMDKNENKKDWLTYWAVFGSFLIIDTFSNIIMTIIPFYFVFKLCFLCWMILPGSNGCRLVYNFLIFKLFKSIEGWVDFFFSESKTITKEFIKEYKLSGFKKMKQIQQGFKVFGGPLLKRKHQGTMEEAVKAAQELQEEMKKSKTFSTGIENKNDGIFNSSIEMFPNKMEKKYFKEELEEISKNSIPEIKNEEKGGEEDIQLSFINLQKNKDNNMENKDNNEDKKVENIDNNKDMNENKKEQKNSLEEEDLDMKMNQMFGAKEEQKEENKNQEEKKEEKENEKNVEENKEEKNADMTKENKEKNNQVPKEEEILEKEKEEKEKEPKDNFGEKISSVEQILTGAVMFEQKKENKEEKKDEEKKEEEIIKEKENKENENKTQSINNQEGVLLSEMLKSE